MFKKLLMCLIIIVSVSLVGCKAGTEVKVNSTEYSIILNSGSTFVYTFKDPNTGVWYISTSNGVTPRLKADGTLYSE